MIQAFLAEQLDYIFFIYGFALLLLAAAIAAIVPAVYKQPRWAWLGFFSLFNGIVE